MQINKSGSYNQTPGVELLMCRAACLSRWRDLSNLTVTKQDVHRRIDPARRIDQAATLDQQAVIPSSNQVCDLVTSFPPITADFCG